MSRLTPPQMHCVRIEAHAIPPRWLVSRQVVKLPASDAEAARRRVVRWALADAGAPPLRSIITRSMKFSSCTRTETQPDATVPQLDGQMELAA